MLDKFCWKRFLYPNIDKCHLSKKTRVPQWQAFTGIRSLNSTLSVQSLDRWAMTSCTKSIKKRIYVHTFLLFENLIITLLKSPSICFWRHSWCVPDSSKLGSAHLSYQEGFVVQFPRNTRSSEIVSNLNFTWSLKSQVFSAFEPVEQIGKLCSPAKNKPKHGFCSEKSLPSERC